MPVKPSENEERYFLEQAAKRLIDKSRQERAATVEVETKRLKELHFMHCPKCGRTLATEKYGNVEIDVCGGCQGLWLDATELNVILESDQKRGLLQAFSRVLGG